jgi:hypothetical protein
MYRPRKTKLSLDDGSLDSLMDVLTCAVGVLIFIVIFAVIEAQGTSVLMYAPPLLREPPADSRRVVVLAQNRRMRILDINAALKQLLKDSDRLTYAQVPDFVESANRNNVSDRHFRYRLTFRDEGYGENNRKRVVSVRVEEKSGIIGDEIDDFGDGSSVFEQALGELDAKKHWLAFGVDAESLKIFRRARVLALENGFSTGWDPMAIKFPYEEVVLGGGDEKKVVGKPRSGLGITQ